MSSGPVISVGRRARTWFAVAATLSSILIVVAAVPAMAGPPPVPPPNDDWANATRARPLPFVDELDQAAATTEPSEPGSFCNGPGASVWYWFKANTTTSVRASTIGTAYDTAIDVWTGSALPSLEEVTCDAEIQSGDGPAIRQSRVTWKAVAGEKYYIRVTATVGTGLLHFELEEVTRPANDDFAGATLLGLPFDGTVNNTKSSIQNGEIDAAGECSDAYATRWYRISLSTTRVVRADTLGADNDTVMAVYTGDTIGDLVQRACNDDTGVQQGSFASSIAWTAKAGNDYYLQVGGWNGDTGKIPLLVKTVAAPDNDDWADAQNVPASSLPYVASGTTRNATWQSAESLDTGCSDPRYQSVWFKHTAVSNDALEVSVDSDSWSSQVAIYRGNSLGTLTQIQCGGQFTPDIGRTYYFQVAGDTNAGPYEFELREADIAP